MKTIYVDANLIMKDGSAFKEFYKQYADNIIFLVAANDRDTYLWCKNLGLRVQIISTESEGIYILSNKMENFDVKNLKIIYGAYSRNIINQECYLVNSWSQVSDIISYYKYLGGSENNEKVTTN